MNKTKQQKIHLTDINGWETKIHYRKSVGDLTITQTNKEYPLNTQEVALVKEEVDTLISFLYNLKR